MRIIDGILIVALAIALCTNWIIYDFNKYNVQITNAEEQSRDHRAKIDEIIRSDRDNLEKAREILDLQGD